jgi:flagellar biosynthesis/type III secretory pathway protein FliH
MADDQRNAKSFTALKDYKPPVYHETVWPVVSERREEANFVSANFERIERDDFIVDPMFEDFNNTTDQNIAQKESHSSCAIELSSEAGDFEFAPVEAPILGDANEVSFKEGHEEISQDSTSADHGEIVEQPRDPQLEARAGHQEGYFTDTLEPQHTEPMDCAVLAESRSLSELQPDGVLEEQELTGDLIEEGEEERNFDSQTLGDTERDDDFENLPNQEHASAARASELSDVSSANVEGTDLSPELLAQAYAKGCRDTRDEVSQVQSQLEERYALLWEDMQNQVDELVKLHEAKAVELALAVAKRLVGDVVDERRDYIQGVVSQAVELSHGAKILSVRVGPHDFEFLKLSQYAEQTRLLLGEGVKFVSDESIRAGCVLVTSAGEVDLNLDSAWERIRSRVLAKG